MFFLITNLKDKKIIKNYKLYYIKNCILKSKFLQNILFILFILDLLSLPNLLKKTILIKINFNLYNNYKYNLLSSNLNFYLDSLNDPLLYLNYYTNSWLKLLVINLISKFNLNILNLVYDIIIFSLKTPLIILNFHFRERSEYYLTSNYLNSSFFVLNINDFCFLYPYLPFNILLHFIKTNVYSSLCEAYIFSIKSSNTQQNICINMSSFLLNLLLFFLKKNICIDLSLNLIVVCLDNLLKYNNINITYIFTKKNKKIKILNFLNLIHKTTIVNSISFYKKPFKSPLNTLIFKKELKSFFSNRSYGSIYYLYSFLEHLDCSSAFLTDAWYWTKNSLFSSLFVLLYNRLNKIPYIIDTKFPTYICNNYNHICSTFISPLELKKFKLIIMDSLWLSTNDSIFYFNYKIDNRGRSYLNFTLSPTNSKFCRYILLFSDYIPLTLSKIIYFKNLIFDYNLKKQFLMLEKEQQFTKSALLWDNLYYSFYNKDLTKMPTLNIDAHASIIQMLIILTKDHVLLKELCLNLTYKKLNIYVQLINYEFTTLLTWLTSKQHLFFDKLNFNNQTIYQKKKYSFYKFSDFNLQNLIYLVLIKKSFYKYVVISSIYGSTSSNIFLLVFPKYKDLYSEITIKLAIKFLVNQIKIKLKISLNFLNLISSCIKIFKLESFFFFENEYIYMYNNYLRLPLSTLKLKFIKRKFFYTKNINLNCFNKSKKSLKANLFHMEDGYISSKLKELLLKNNIPSLSIHDTFIIPSDTLVIANYFYNKLLTKELHSNSIIENSLKKLIYYIKVSKVSKSLKLKYLALVTQQLKILKQRNLSILKINLKILNLNTLI